MLCKRRFWDARTTADVQRVVVRLLPLFLVISHVAWTFVPSSAGAQATPVPYQSSLYGELFEDVIDDINRYWQAQFDAFGIPYRTASVNWVDLPTSSLCGQVDPINGPGSYCPLNETIYLSIPWYQQLMADGVDFAWVTVAAHEWGHHVQFLLRIERGSGSAFELQADCLAGAYANDAAKSGLLERGDITEAARCREHPAIPPGCPLTTQEPMAAGTIA